MSRETVKLPAASISGILWMNNRIVHFIDSVRTQITHYSIIFHAQMSDEMIIQII